MTTFIDFRYAKKLSSALLSGYQPEESRIILDLPGENYIAAEFAANYPDKNLISFLNEDGLVMANIRIELDHSISFILDTGKILLKTPPGSLLENGNIKHILGLRLSHNTVGFKLHERIYESKNSFFDIQEKLIFQPEENNNSIQVLGKGSGRAKKWAELYYNRSIANGLGVEIVMDWHHLRSGIPLNGTLTAEKLIELTNFQLQFNSYVIEKEEAQVSDFVKLFSSSKKPEISLHITPTLYTHFNPDTLNIGLFVNESKKIIPGIAERCNMMDSIIVPTTFVSEIYKKNKVKCPIYIVPHGVDLDFYKPVSERKALPGGREFNFLAVSTYVERKNIRHLVRAFLEEFGKDEDVALFLLLRPEFGTTQYNVTLEFDKWEKKYFRSSAPILLSTGYTTRETLQNFYANADTYVMPSNEGFGLTLLESLASGTPVIGLDYGGVRDFVNNTNGYLVPKGKSFISKDIDSVAYMGDLFYEPDIKKLREAMRQAFENKEEAYRKGFQGRMDCEKNFTWDQTGAGIAKVIEKTYEQSLNHKQKFPQSKPSKKKIPFISLILCVPDDTPIKSSLKFLRKKRNVGNEVLCLFTRYAKFKEVMRARRNGFLYHRWDGSFSNCKSIIQNIILTEWSIILYPGEKLNAKSEALTKILDSLPKEISEVAVLCPNGNTEVRLIRTRCVKDPKQTVIKEACIL